MQVCRACLNAKENQIFLVREMMFGTREKFQYFKCSNCESIQISETPSDISKYYPDNYYSFKNSTSADSWLKRWLKHLRAKYALHPSLLNVAGNVVSRIWGPAEWQVYLPPGIGFQSSVLDVGCGSGVLLNTLANDGFTNLMGIDAYISEERCGKGFAVKKMALEELDGTYDLIMMHHSFEHMSDPRATLQALAQRLTLNGWIVIRTPVVAKAWEIYGPDWVQLDAPRHFFIPSQRGMQILADATGLGVKRIAFDSNEYQFWASEQYKQNIPLTDKRSFKNNRSLFPEEKIKAYRTEAIKLNKASLGDQAAFFLQLK